MGYDSSLAWLRDHPLFNRLERSEKIQWRINIALGKSSHCLKPDIAWVNIRTAEGKFAMPVKIEGEHDAFVAAVNAIIRSYRGPEWAILDSLKNK